MKTSVVDIPAEAETSKSKNPPTESRIYEPGDSAGKPPARISIPLDDTGAVDLSRLRGDTKERLKQAIAAPSVQVELLGKEPEPIFSAGDVAALYAAYSQVEQIVARLAMRVPADIAAESFVFTQQDLEMLIPPTQGVLTKYAPAMVSGNKDLIALTLILAGVTQRQFEHARELSKVRQAKDVSPATATIQQQTEGQ